MSVFQTTMDSNKDVTQAYPYSQYIKTPAELGASPAGNLTALGNDIGALIGYTQVLISGDSAAQSVSPLGNKYFLNTGGTCTDTNGQSQTRYIYMNNVPSGRIPLISSAMGADMTQFRGLIPGTLESAAYLNPLVLLKAFSTDNTCQEITMSTRDTLNRDSVQSQYVNQHDIEEYDACWFDAKVNPVTGDTCREAMTTRSNDIIVQTYFLGVGALGIFLLYRLMK
jgi:hypothetical protein